MSYTCVCVYIYICVLSYLWSHIGDFAIYLLISSIFKIFRNWYLGDDMYNTHCSANIHINFILHKCVVAVLKASLAVLPLKWTSPSSSNEFAVKGLQKLQMNHPGRCGILKTGNPGDELHFVAISHQNCFHYLDSSWLDVYCSSQLPSILHVQWVS